MAKTAGTAENESPDQQSACSDPWRTPFKAPPFDRIEAKHFTPAFRLALKEHKAELRTIAERPAKASFQKHPRGTREKRRASEPRRRRVLQPVEHRYQR